MKRLLNSSLVKTEKNGQQNVSRCNVEGITPTLGPIARMAPVVGQVTTLEKSTFQQENSTLVREKNKM